MTGPLRFCFGLHLHQPVGNFDSVFEQHLADVYRPLLRACISGELFPVAMHVSGPLLEWLDSHAPDFIDEIGHDVADGRIEILCAGHDEPILAVLPPADRVEQLQRHRDWIRRRWGVNASGLWLTERVWEPTLPETLAQAGIDFVLVDDRHFRVTGFAESQLHQHFVTEAGGHRVGIFPIDEKLRYLVPFRPPAELAEYFRNLRSEGHQIAILADDGEKFGGWPGTRKWLYDDGWLEDFLGTMRQLRDEGDVALTRFDVALRETPSGGLAYLPSASYREMEGWSLPFAPARALLRLEHDWAGARIDGIEGGLLRGGHWRNFLVKYPESNRMHKWMLALSALCRERGDPAVARRAIGRAQCNDAYWHGVFGGLYLPFLRGAIWQQLAIAEAALRAGESLHAELLDLDADGSAEVWIHSSHDSLLLSPHRGGIVDTWLDLEHPANLLNVVARHREAYHEPLLADPTAPGHASTDSGAPSIHDLEGQLTEVPAIDREPRGLLVDRVIAADSTRDDFVAGQLDAIRSWAGVAMTTDLRCSTESAVVTLTAKDLEKTIEFVPGSEGTAAVLTCKWRWNPGDFPAESWFTTELSFETPLAITSGGSKRWGYAIETVAKSEKGFDRSVQGRAVVLRWPIAAGQARVRVSAAESGRPARE